MEGDRQKKRTCNKQVSLLDGDKCYGKMGREKAEQTKEGPECRWRVEWGLQLETGGPGEPPDMRSFEQ